MIYAKLLTEMSNLEEFGHAMKSNPSNSELVTKDVVIKYKLHGVDHYFELDVVDLYRVMASEAANLRRELTDQGVLKEGQ